MTAQAAGAADTYESAKSGTIYWTDRKSVV